MLSVKKILNVIKLTISFLLSLITGRLIHWGLPMGLSVEPANICNLACKECPIGQNLLMRQKQEMPIEIYNKVLNELSPFLSNIIIYFQGEPFMYAQIFDMISYAYDKKVYSIVSTNGHYFTEKKVEQIFTSHLGRLIISLDGTSQDVYEKYRVGGSLEKVLKGTQLIVSKRNTLQLKHPEIIFQFLVTSQNEHQIEDAKILAKKIRVDRINFKTAQIYDFENGNPLIPKNEKFSRYKRQKNGKYKIKSKLKNHCWRMWSHPVITSSGDVVPCCFDKDAKYVMGNINTNSFKEIWTSETYNNFRKKVFQNRKSIDICRNCTEGLFRVLK